MNTPVNLNVAVSIDYKLDFNGGRERARKNLESWINNKIVNDKREEIQTIERLENEIGESGFYEEYGTHGITISFHMNSKDNLNFNSNQSGNLDPVLFKENWIDKEDFEKLEIELEKLCMRVADDYDKSVL